MSEPAGPFYDNQVHVLDRKCSTCIFRPGNLMHLAEGRVDDLVSRAVANEGSITCHDTIHRDDGVRPAVCRGFYDVHGMRVWLLRLAKRMKAIVFVDPPPPHPIRAAFNTQRRGRQSVGAPAARRRTTGE